MSNLELEIEQDTNIELELENSSVSWGNIRGTITNQTDLINNFITYEEVTYD